MLTSFPSDSFPVKVLPLPVTGATVGTHVYFKEKFQQSNHMMKNIAFTFLLVLAANLHSHSQQVPLANMSIARLEKDIPRLLKESDVPGLTIALIRDGRLVWSGAFGLANADTKKRVTPNTVFEAASLSKPVFAYAVLKLVDEGKLILDTPLN